jgi:hypothetical protein
LAQAAGKVYADLLGGDSNEREIEAVFLRLVRLGDTGGATRRIARRREFSGQRWQMLQALADEKGNRLVQIGGPEGDERVEIAHEALVTQWPRFQRWLQAAAGDKRTLGQLIERAAAWAASEALAHRPGNSSDGKDQDLATGAELQLFEDLVKRHRAWLSLGEIGYVGASSKAREREETRRNWLFRAVTGASILFAVAAATALSFYRSTVEQKLYADGQAEHAREQTRLAESELRKSQTTQSLFLASLAREGRAEGDAGAALLLALEALPDSASIDDHMCPKRNFSSTEHCAPCANWLF